jgi:hypothetical protein
MAKLLREAQVPMLQVGYEQLVASPESELARIFAFLDLPHDPGAVNYGQRFDAKEGMGDPIGVKQHDRPTTASVEKWVFELKADAKKRKLAEQLVTRLDDADLAAWGYPRDTLFEALDTAKAGTPPKPPTWNRYVFQRRVMLALKKDIATRPHGKLLQRVKYYCDVLLREA